MPGNTSSFLTLARSDRDPPTRNSPTRAGDDPWKHPKGWTRRTAVSTERVGRETLRPSASTQPPTPKAPTPPASPPDHQETGASARLASSATRRTAVSTERVRRETCHPPASTRPPTPKAPTPPAPPRDINRPAPRARVAPHARACPRTTSYASRKPRSRASRGTWRRCGGRS